MRLPADTSARRRALALILVPALAACGSHEPLASASGAGAAVAANGPAADYPMVIGEPYRVGATLYTPADTMNYDEVGYAAADSGAGVTGSHHTLPLPSYVEVTSLTTGKTILVRLSRRGPLDGDSVIALSPAAFAQLGASAGEPVRVRRVNPPEEERAALRAGRTAPPRMDTPTSLIAVLKRKLPDAGSASLAARPAAKTTPLAQVALPPSSASQQRPVQQPALAPAGVTQAAARKAPPPLPPLSSTPPQTAPSTSSRPVVVARLEEASPHAVATPSPPRAVAPDPDGVFIVQAAAMSTVERARKVASAIGGSVSQSGRYYRVRTGPFATRQQAEASLAKVRAAGYSDARIFPNG